MREIDLAASSSTSFRSDVQGLRALAVVAVVLYHAHTPGFPGGYVGVDIFFVISGYLITGLLLREIEKTGTVDFRAFYGRRIRRLLPALTVVLLMTAIAAGLLLSALEQREHVWPIFSSAIYVSNFWFAWSATDYLGGDASENLVTHTWSLSVEEQFYLVWPILLLSAARAGSSTRRPARVALAMTALLAVSFVASVWIMTLSRPWAFFASPLRAWEFGAGALVIAGEKRIAGLSISAKNALAVPGAAAIVLAVAGFDGQTPFPGVAAWLPVSGTALLVLAGSTPPSTLSRALGIGPARWIGDRSYSWYLWHWPVILLWPVIVPSSGSAGLAAAVLLSLALAAVTYTWIENPARSHPLFASAPWRSLALGACLTIVGAGSAMALRAGATAGALAGIVSARANPIIYEDGCHAGFLAIESGPCTYGKPDARRTVYLIGDSHAGQWFPALERIANEQQWRLVSLTKSVCPMAAVSLDNLALGREYGECAHWRANVLRRIARERPDIVVVAASAAYVSDPRYQVTRDEWQGGMRTLLLDLRRAAAAVAVLRDTPRPGFDVPKCLARAAQRGQPASACDFLRSATLDGIMFQLDRKAASGLDGVSLLDLSDAICSGDRCFASRDGWVTYRDTNHLSLPMSRGLAPVVLDRLLASGLSRPVQ